MNTEEILRELREDTFAALAPSPIHGIGVFAIRDIPKGCKTIFSKDNGDWIPVPIKEVEKLPEHSRNLVETYCLYDEENYFLPSYGFKIIDLVNYLNHSNEPNIQSVNNGLFFEALRDIAKGEELLINYNYITETDEGYT